MKKRRMISLVLAGMVALCPAVSVHAGTEDEIAYMQEQRDAAEASLYQTQSNIDSLEGKKQELEWYLEDLNSQYNELTNSVAELGIQAAQKGEELKQIKRELRKAKKASKKQYEDMKLRIAYIYEKGETSTLELLLSADSFTEFLNRVENVSEISKYDRDMLEKYEKLSESISEKQRQVKEEAALIDELMNEKAARQQEVQALAASTSESIASYVNQISASREEASALMAEINNADNAISDLMIVAQQEKEAREAAEAAAREAESEGDDSSDESYEEDDSSDSGEEYSEESYSEEEDSYSEESEGDGQESYEEEAADSEESYEESAAEESGQGTYLGNFTLTAYCNCAQCCGTAGNLTASGTVPTAGRTVAMAGVPFGTQLLINGNVYTVEDLGTPYGHVDVYFDSHSDALAFGLQYADVYQVN